MIKLASIPKTELSPYVIQLLNKNGILSVYEFLHTDSEKLSKITNLTHNVICELIEKIQDHYISPLIKLSTTLFTVNDETFNTGIQKLDEMLNVLQPGNITEICGKAGIGKTQLCFTFAVNFLKNNPSYEALYIDLKHDFSGSRIFQILHSKNVPKFERGSIMQRLKVERVAGLTNSVMLLQKFLEQSDSESRIKIMIVDSLPAVCFHHGSDDDKLEGKFLLSTFANLMYKIAKEQSVAVCVVNLLVPEREQFIDLIEDSNNITQRRNSSSNPACAMRPALGHFWSRVPTIRLLLRMPDITDITADLRTIEVMKSCYTPTGSQCNVRINEAGFVDTS